ncbi:hypothetical protein Pla52n_38530 [Stieleria varia]|uniref:DNA repair protein n=2 Tax=Stieleria varia TaxID=2528005 RepID=A0A5C6AXD8_9BACT|nr:hypothetical protein Pla52n_38530 [Stieleria varia]
MHNHGPNDQLVYQYPRVQFKVLDRHAYLVGIAEGSELLQRLWMGFDSTTLGNEELPVIDSQFSTNQHSFLLSDDPIRYRFATPWLALNQTNFREYTQSRSQSFRLEKLNKTLVGNCLGMCKSLGIRFSGRISADCTDLSSIKTTLKGQGMIGFVGTFLLNVALPDLIGLGKSVSRGFGSIERRSP